MKNLICLSILVFLLLIAQPIKAQQGQFWIWVFDQNSTDSQFGYYNGTAAIDIGSVFKDYDVEGLACLDNVIYGTSGHDGRRTSELFTISIDAAANQTALTKVGNIESRDHQPYFEVAALAEKSDGTLWAYADAGSQRGIIRIDPTTAIAEMIKPSRYKVEGIEWLGETLWLVGNRQFYTWSPGGEITKAFTIASSNEIEALDTIEGLLWVNIPQNKVTMIPIEPTTGQIRPGGFQGHEDIESLTYCQLAPPIPPTPIPPTPIPPTPIPTATSTPSPTATLTATPTVPPTATIIPSPISSVTTTQTATPAVSQTATPTLPPLVPTTPAPTASSTATPKTTPTITPPALLTPTSVVTTTTTPVNTSTPNGTPASRTTPFGPTPEVTPAIPTNETDDDEPFTGYEIFLPASHR